MTTKKLFLLSFACAVIGALFYAMHRGWIIITIPSATSHYAMQAGTLPAALSKKVTLFFWHHDAWHHESTQLVWGEHTAHNIAYLVNSWLSLLDDEKITSKKVSLQTAMLNPTGTELYLSFDRSLFSKESTTYDKWMLVEGLLKTLRENGITPQGVRFLVHHQQMMDFHLDFSSPWPIFGFIS